MRGKFIQCVYIAKEGERERERNLLFSSQKSCFLWCVYIEGERERERERNLFFLLQVLLSLVCIYRGREREREREREEFVFSGSCFLWCVFRGCVAVGFYGYLDCCNSMVI